MKFLSRSDWLPIALATILLAAVLSLISPVFLSLANLQAILTQSSVTGIMAVGMTFVIVTGGIDISVGAIVFLTAAVFSKLLFDSGDFSLALSVSLVLAAVLGGLNGLLTSVMKVPPLIVTLATFSVFRGTAIHLTDAANIPVAREYGFIGNGRLAGIPVPILMLLVVVLIGALLLRLTRLGLNARAIGSSARSAVETGLKIRLTTVAVYTMAGLTSGLAAIILLTRVGGLQGGLGIGLEFTVIAAVVLGGTKLAGGTGTIVGSLFGAIFLVLIENGLNLLSASPFIYDIVRGLVLVAAVAVDRFSVRGHVATPVNLG